MYQSTEASIQQMSDKLSSTVKEFGGVYYKNARKDLQDLDTSQYRKAMHLELEQWISLNQPLIIPIPMRTVDWNALSPDRWQDRRGSSTGVGVSGRQVLQLAGQREIVQRGNGYNRLLEVIGNLRQQESQQENSVSEAVEHVHDRQQQNNSLLISQPASSSSNPSSNEMLAPYLPVRRTSITHDSDLLQGLEQ